MNDINYKALLSISDYAKKLGVQRKVIYLAISKGLMVTTDIGVNGKYRFVDSEKYPTIPSI